MTNKSRREPDVVLEQDDQDRHDPGDCYRPERPEIRKQPVADPPCREREHLALFYEIGGKEDHEQELGDLYWLEGDWPDADPELHAVQLGFGRPSYVGSEREHQQAERREHEHVAVALEVSDGALTTKWYDIGDDAEGRPDRLVVPRGVGPWGGVEAVDHDKADAVQHENDRHDHRIGLGGEETVGDVDYQSQAGRDAPMNSKRVGGKTP